MKDRGQYKEMKKIITDRVFILGTEEGGGKQWVYAVFKGIKGALA